MVILRLMRLLGRGVSVGALRWDSRTEYIELVATRKEKKKKLFKELERS